jgi:hypothetical protein
MKANATTTIYRETETEEFEIDITARYYGGCPEKGPTYDCGGQPADPESVEILCAFIGKEEVELTTEEEERAIQQILESPPERDSDY